MINVYLFIIRSVALRLNNGLRTSYCTVTYILAILCGRALIFKKEAISPVKPEHWSGAIFEKNVHALAIMCQIDMRWDPQFQILRFSVAFKIWHRAFENVDRCLKFSQYLDTFFLFTFVFTKLILFWFFFVGRKV